nr:hypothetical protein [Tanacetum cinerariifolium]
GAGLCSEGGGVMVGSRVREVEWTGVGGNSDNEYILVIAKDGRCFVDTSEVTTGNTLLSTTGLTTARQ